MTWIELVKEVSPKWLSDEEADKILWEQTGFPDCWGDASLGSPEEICRSQLKDFFENKRRSGRLR